jgi:Glycosyltransferase family 87
MAPINRPEASAAEVESHDPTMKSTVAPRHRRPLGGLTGQAWVNLAIAALILYYTAQVILNIAWSNMFGDLGIDFRSFWSAGYVANHHGYAAVYDLAILGGTERSLLPTAASTSFVFQVIPTPYLPVFILPFQVLALLPPTVAAYIWIALNTVATGLYLWSFLRRAGIQRIQFRLLLLAAVSAPVFLNLFTGQVNLLLMICIGESLLATLSGRHFHAGLWLAGMLLKPQSLILIIPALLIRRQLKPLAGLLAGGAAVVAASWMLAGSAALTALARLWLGYAGGLPTNDPQLMMNWRMIAISLGNVGAAALAPAIVVGGIAATIVAVLTVWWRQAASDDSQFEIAFVVLLAGTAVVTWHSHVHMAMILLPPLLLLAHRHRDVLGNLLEWWVLLPAALYVLRILLAAIMHLGRLGGGAYALLDFLAGIGLFGMNVLLVAWGMLQGRPWPHAAINRPQKAN